MVKGRGRKGRGGQRKGQEKGGGRGEREGWKGEVRSWEGGSGTPVNPTTIYGGDLTPLTFNMEQNMEGTLRH